MRTILTMLAAVTFAAGVFAQGNKTPAATGADSSTPQKIGTADADKYYDQTMIVTGKVVQVTIRPTVTFLNMDKAFPDSPFTAVIFHGHSSFYGDANALRGKSIEIKGKITKYREKPEIALDSTNQLTVFDANGVNITAAILQTTNRPAATPQAPKTAPVPTTGATTNFPEIM
jgi:DNA/RNA endonuclease YhcR with UshA esterase domain